MNKVFFMRIIMISLIFPLAIFHGCSSTKSIANVSVDTFSSVANRILPGGKTTFTKRVLLLHFVNQSEMGDDTLSQMKDTFLRILEEDETLLLSTPKKPIQTEISKDSSQFGVVIDPVIVKKAEEMNMDILIMPTLNPIDVSLKKKGIWPFRKHKREIEIFISITVLDVTNGTLFLTNIEKRKIKLKEEVWEEDADIWELDENIVVKGSIPILEDHASAIHKVLKGKPWTGKITQIEGANITINGGKEIGIREDIIFEVFGKGEPIKALDGNEYYTRGSKAGEIKIYMVKEGYSIGTPLSGAQFETGQTLKLMK